MTASARRDTQWLKIIEDLLAGDKDARETTWRRVFHHIEHSVRLNIGPLSDDKEVRRDIAVRVLHKLEANEHKNLRAWVERQHRGTDGCSWLGFINVAARRCAIDYARTSCRNVARRGEPFQWVREDPEDPAVLVERLESSSKLTGCSESELYNRLVRFQDARRETRSEPPLPPPRSWVRRRAPAAIAADRRATLRARRLVSSAPMIERDIDIPTPDGAMNSFVVHPDEGGPFPVVLFYMDAPGKREELHDMARRLAAVGYYVVLPNLYYRTTREFVMVRDEAGFKHMFELLRGLSIEMILRDTAAMLAFVDGEPAARAQSLGAVGYCMSGPFVVAAAARFPDRVHCAASIYGAGLVTERPDSPHLMLKQVRGELYFACAEIDKYAPRDQIDAFEAQLAASGIRYRLEWYPGAEHGFAFPQRPGIYHKPSAERHWTRLFALFRRNLG